MRRYPRGQMPQTLNELLIVGVFFLCYMGFIILVGSCL